MDGWIIPVVANVFEIIIYDKAFAYATAHNLFSGHPNQTSDAFIPRLLLYSRLRRTGPSISIVVMWLPLFS